MKRARVGSRSSIMSATPEGEQGFWPSFADMMSSFALILFFLMLISYLQNLITGNELVSTEEKLSETEKTLADTKQQVLTAEEELALVTIDLDDARLALLEQQADMAEYAATIAGQTATITQQESLITEQVSLIAEQKVYISLTTDELTRLRSQMQTIALLRLSILTKIKDNISKTLGSGDKVSVGDNGSIILNEGLFFDYNSSKIKQESYPLLNELTKAFTSFLSDGENAQYVDSVVISGHSDNSGGDTRNRELSTERANAVLNYLLDENGAALKPYAAYFCAAGYGSTRPVASNDTADGRSRNRRIEISVILKDETVLEIVDAYLASEMPGATATPAPGAAPAASVSPAPVA